MICEGKIKGFWKQIYMNAHILIHLAHNIVYLHMNKCAKWCCMKKRQMHNKDGGKGISAESIWFYDAY